MKIAANPLRHRVQTHDPEPHVRQPRALIGRRPRSIANPISRLDGAAPPPSLPTTEPRARRHEEDGMRERMSF